MLLASLCSDVRRDLAQALEEGRLGEGAHQLLTHPRQRAAHSRVARVVGVQGGARAQRRVWRARRPVAAGERSHGSIPSAFMSDASRSASRTGLAITRSIPASSASRASSGAPCAVSRTIRATPVLARQTRDRDALAGAGGRQVEVGDQPAEALLLEQGFRGLPAGCAVHLVTAQGQVLVQSKQHGLLVVDQEDPLSRPLAHRPVLVGHAGPRMQRACHRTRSRKSSAGAEILVGIRRRGAVRRLDSRSGTGAHAFGTFRPSFATFW